MGMDWTIFVAAASPLASIIIGYLTANVAGRAAIHQAANDERRQSDEHWERFNTNLRLDNEALRERIGKLDEEVSKQVDSVRKHASKQLEDAQQEHTELISAIHREYTERLSNVEKRLSEAERTATAAEFRASKAERMYSLAIVYLREVFAWAKSAKAGEPPPVPAELEPDL
jgi:gas vesicle protein